MQRKKDDYYFLRAVNRLAASRYPKQHNRGFGGPKTRRARPPPGLPRARLPFFFFLLRAAASPAAAALAGPAFAPDQKPKTTFERPAANASPQFLYMVFLYNPKAIAAFQAENAF
jgi:hypothetical protein